MSAAELFEEAKRLSVEERERLIQSLLDMDLGEEARAISDRKVDWSGTFARAKRIFGDRVLPNLVLEERESYNY
jgi:hypothetical protein